MTASSGSSPRKRITPYLPAGLADRLAAYCATADITESAAVEAAVGQYLDDTSHKTLVQRRLDRLGHAIERLQRDQEIHAEAFVIFVKLWLAYVPAISSEAREAARRAADGRFQEFLGRLKKRVSAIERLRHLIADEPIADHQQLFANAAEPPDEGTSSGKPG